MWFWMFCFLHIMCCGLLWLLRRRGKLKTQGTAFAIALCVPLWGPACLLLVHLAVAKGWGSKKEIGLEKLRVNEEIYKNIIVSDTETDRRVVPLEEALLINDSAVKRGLILDVLNQSPEEYVELLRQARLNDDAEVVHYAITAMAEMSKEYDLNLQSLEAAYAADPQNEEILDEYISFLDKYLKKEMAQGQYLNMQRNQMASLLKKKLSFRESLEWTARLVEIELDLEQFDEAALYLERMEARWPGQARTKLLKIRYFAQQRRGDRIKETIGEIEREEIYLSAEDQEFLRFWTGRKQAG